MFFKHIIEEKLSQKIIYVSALAGGDINQVFKLKTNGETFVVKVNGERRFPQLFEKEKLGLHLLADTGIKTPEVIAEFKQDSMQFLVLQYIEEENKTSAFWNNFANDLVKLHQKHSDFCGLGIDNYIGSIEQSNTIKESWEVFFIENRIHPLIHKAFNNGLLQNKHLQGFENIFQKLNEIIPQEPPSLLHGDLWSGNLMTGKNQCPVFIDPAVYFGHREMDIAMTRLFGGFDNTFLDVYNEKFPLQKGWKERIAIHNLYPNLVHLLIFGSSYLSGIERVISKFY